MLAPSILAKWKLSCAAKCKPPVAAPESMSPPCGALPSSRFAFSAPIQRTMDELAAGFAPPAPEEVLAFYNNVKDHFAPAEKIHAAHIIVHVSEERGEAEARRLIEAAEAELAAGVLFAEVAERFSDCKGNGGDLGWFERGTMVDEFDEAVFALEPGQRSGIFRTPFGYHIAELNEK